MSNDDTKKSTSAPGAAPAPGGGRRQGPSGGRSAPRREGAGGDRRGGPGGPGGRGGPRGRRDGKPRRRRDDDRPIAEWEPKTRLGRMVKKGEIKSMSDAVRTGFPLREPEIVDILLPELEDEVLNVNMVQRMTDSGRRVRFAITAIAGNGDGFVGLGQAKGKEVGPTIRRAIDKAKINMIEVARGAGSWASGDGAPALSVPFQTSGKCASTEVTIRPAPQGTGVVAGNIAKSVLRLAGIQDAWVFAKGQTRTTTNYAKATFTALSALGDVKMTADQEERITLVRGAQNIKKPEEAEGEDGEKAVVAEGGDK